MFREHVIECRQRRPGPGASRGVCTASPDLSGESQRSIRESHRHRYAVGRAARNSLYHSGHDSLNYSAPRARQRRPDEDVHDIFLHMITRRAQPYATGGRNVLTPQITLPQRLSVRYTRYRDSDFPPPTPP